ncbi:MAG: histidine kinase, partial [Rhodospirillaceae bacterium]|nr:histidine kinase [Rhodospirillaceae bacterium]
IVNELISNALKHAFPDARRGKLQVDLRRESDDFLLLSVSDDGIGLPSGLDIKTAPTLGLQLVTLLTDQLRGTLSIGYGNSTRFAIRFPLTG